MIRTYKIGVFEHEENFISSIKSLHEKDIEILDVFTPYPIHEVFKLLKRKSKLPTVAYFMGLFGIASTLGFLYWAAVINWPVVYGGKPVNSFPSFIVITIVLTILTVTIGGLAVFSARSKLFPGRDNTIFSSYATDDRFVIVIESGALDKSSADAAENIMNDMGAAEVMDKEFDNVRM